MSYEDPIGQLTGRYPYLIRLRVSVSSSSYLRCVNKIVVMIVIIIVVVVNDKLLGVRGVTEKVRWSHGKTRHLTI